MSIYSRNLSKMNWKHRCGNGFRSCKISGRIYQLNSLLFYNEKTLSLIGQTFCHSHVIFSFFVTVNTVLLSLDRMTAPGKRYNPRDQHFNLKSQMGNTHTHRRKSDKPSLKTKAAFHNQKLDEKHRANLKQTPEVVLSVVKTEEILGWCKSYCGFCNCF